MTDTEITEKLAEFMGYELPRPTNECKCALWNPLENISDAWEIVDELLKDRIYMSFSLSYDLVLDSYKFALREYDEILSWDYWPNEKSAPRAICMAVLKVVEDG